MGKKKVTFADIAKYTNFSKTTISRYFNNPDSLTLENQEKIAKALDDLGYQENKLAKVLANGKSEFIGIIIPNLYLHYYSEMLNQLLSSYSDYHYKFLVFVSSDKKELEQQYLDELMSYKIEGLIILSHTFSSEELASYHIPIVAIEREAEHPYLTVRRAWHTEHNRPVISDELKTKAAERNIPLPVCLAECLKTAKETSTSEYVVSNRDGEPLSYTQFKRLWQYIVTRTVKERSYYRYEDGKRVKHTVTPVLGEKAAHNGKVVYSLDFEVTPHQLRHTYITNLIHASVDPKTVQYLAGHESSKITMDIYAKVKYNRPDELVRSMNCAFASWDAAQ